MVTGSVQGVSVRGITAYKYMERKSFPAGADNFSKYRNDSYIDVKCSNRMPQPVE